MLGTWAMRRCSLGDGIDHTGHVVVVGQMGVGKSTLATALAEEFGRDHLDSDVTIEGRTGRTGRDIATSDGVAVLHDLELEVLLEHLARERPAIVSAAASVLDAAAGRRALADPTVLWLDLPVPDLLDRIERGPHRRSITVEALEDLDSRRRPHLEQLADLRLDASRPSDEVLAAALDFLHR